MGNPIPLPFEGSSDQLQVKYSHWIHLKSCKTHNKPTTKGVAHFGQVDFLSERARRDVVRNVCLGMGLAGLWLPAGRRHMWALVLGLAGIVVSYLAILLIFSGYFCAYTCLTFLFFTPHFAAIALAWRGKVFPKVFLPFHAFNAAATSTCSYVWGCAILERGFWQRPLYAVVKLLIQFMPFFAWALGLH